MDPACRSWSTTKSSKHSHYLIFNKRLAHMNNMWGSPKYDDLSTYSADVEGPADLSVSEKGEKHG